MAGESARERARRQRQHADRLRHSAQRWERGADAEAATAAVLDELRGRGWTVFADVRWPGRPRANTDHVAVGPGGVFVIDTKNWSGTVAVVDGELRQDGRRREREVSGAAEAALSLTRLLQQVAATPVICFVRDQPVTGTARDVVLCSTANLLDVLLGAPAVLDPESLARVATILRGRLEPAVPRPRQPPTPSVPVRAATTPPVRRRPRRRPWRRRDVGRAVLGLGCVAAFLLGVLVLAPNLGSGAPKLVGLTATRAAIGETVHLDGSSGRPALDLTADRPIPADQHRPRVDAPPGTRLVAVRFRMRNAGDRGWSSPALNAFAATDTTGRRPGRVLVHQLESGAQLREGLRLQHGDVREGYVVFAVPRTARVTRVSVTVGPMPRDTVEWSVR